MPRVAGVLLSLAGFIILMGITTAEIFYPNYSVSKNFISNLASTRPPSVVINEPSATIFDSSMVAAGLLIISAAAILYKGRFKKEFVISMIIMGAGTLGVGVFPAFHAIVHPIVAGITFVSGGITAILSSLATKSPFRFASALLGATTLGFLVSGELLPSIIVPLLGDGGVERWVAYPITLWLVVFGGYLMNGNTKK